MIQINKRQKKKLYKRRYGHNPPKGWRTALCVPEEPKGKKNAAELIVQAGRMMENVFHNMGRILTAFTFPVQEIKQAMAIYAEEEQRALRRELEKIISLQRPEEKAPCIIVAENLTRERAAGRRKKRNEIHRFLRRNRRF